MKMELDSQSNRHLQLQNKKLKDKGYSLEEHYGAMWLWASSNLLSSKAALSTPKLSKTDSDCRGAAPHDLGFMLKSLFLAF